MHDSGPIVQLNCDPLKKSPSFLWVKILISSIYRIEKSSSNHLGKSISQSYQGLMTWGFNDAEHPLCDETSRTLVASMTYLITRLKINQPFYIESNLSQNS